MWCGAGARKTVVAYCLTRICCCSSTAFYCFGWVGGWVGGGRPRSLPTLQACEVSMGKFMSDSDYDRMPSTSYIVPPHHYTPTTTYFHVCALLASCPRAVPLTVLAGCGTQVQLTLRRVGTFAGQGSGFQRNRMFSAYLMPGNSPACPPTAIKPRARVEPPCPGGHPLPGIDPGLNPGSPGIIPRIFDPGLIPG